MLIKLFYMVKINKLESIQVKYQVEQDEKYLQDDDQLMVYQLEKHVLLNVQHDKYAFADQLK